MATADWRGVIESQGMVGLTVWEAERGGRATPESTAKRSPCSGRPSTTGVCKTADARPTVAACRGWLRQQPPLLRTSQGQDIHPASR
jgi:hypothetical protein